MNEATLREEIETVAAAELTTGRPGARRKCPEA